MSAKKTTVNLRTVAERVGLAPCSVSAILNNTPASQAIPQATKDRVFRAASELNYRPNLWAQSLRTKRTRMVVAVASDYGCGPVARVVAGAQSRLQQKGYLLALGTADHSEADHVPAQFRQRGIEGVIVIDSALPGQIDLPVACVDFGYLASSEHAIEGMRTWLTALGESAADAIIQQIENEDAARTINVGDKLPPVFFNLPSVVLASGAEARERA